MKIQNNISANANLLNLNRNSTAVQKSLINLASGYKINKAGDDPSGLTISQKMKAQLAQVNARNENLNYGLSMSQVADSAIGSQQQVLERMGELAVRAGNGIYEDSDRAMMQEEVSQLKGTVDSIAQSTAFNGVHMLAGTSNASTTAGIAAGSSYSRDLSSFDLSDMAMYTQESGNAALQFTGADGSGVSVYLDPNSAAGSDTPAADGSTAASITVGTQGVTDSAALAARLSDALNASGNLPGVSAFATFSGELSITATASSNTAQMRDNLFSGNLDVSIKSGTRSLDMTYRPTSTDFLFKGAGSDVDVSSPDKAASSLSTIGKSMDYLSGQRGRLGAYQNRIESEMNANQIVSQELKNSKSRIEDTDMAKEAIKFSVQKILMQSGTATLAHSNIQSQSVLSLLR